MGSRILVRNAIRDMKRVRDIKCHISWWSQVEDCNNMVTDAIGELRVANLRSVEQCTVEGVHRILCALYIRMKENKQHEFEK